MSETPGDVFEALLAGWKGVVLSLLQSGALEVIEDEEALWRERFDAAEARFIEALKS